MSTRSLSPLATLLLALLGCQNFSDPPVETGYVLGYPNGVVGDLPNMAPGTQVQLAVKVMNPKGKPVAGVEISWDDGYVLPSISPARSRSDTAGLARTVWSIRPLPAGNSVANRVIRAYLPGASHNPIEYRVAVVPCSRCGPPGSP